MLSLRRSYVRWFLIILTCICILLAYRYCKMKHERQKSSYYFNDHGSISCHKATNISRLPDISEETISRGSSIFFHETSCRSYINGKITISPRQACAVESAAKANPELDVYLTFSSPGVFNFEDTESDRVLQKLLSYKNIYIKSMDMETYMMDTPLEDLFTSGKMEKSKYAHSHASDVLRYLTMYKYGGIYLDLDVIVLKSFRPLGLNFAGIEHSGQVDSGVFGFDHDGPGHELVTKCVNYLKSNFSTGAFVGNGPAVITRFLQEACGVKNAFEMSKQPKCQYFKVMHQSAFYPVGWQNWEKYFYPEKIKEVQKLANHSYALHLWSKLSEGVRVPVDVLTPYTIYAAKYCPEVFSACELWI